MAKVKFNRILNSWFVVVGPHHTPISGAFPSRAEAKRSLDRPRAATLRNVVLFDDRGRQLPENRS